ncbi:MAG: hypothetical protein WAM39_16055 [Bryobacteraceae bacterium]
MPDASTIYSFNGINPRTGMPVAAPRSTAELAAVAKGVSVEGPHASQLLEIAKDPQKHFGLTYGIDSKDLSQTGWGVIFPQSENAGVVAALEPLLELRKSQAGSRYKKYNCAPGQSAWDFVTENDADPSQPVDPTVVPYYLLIVADPETISYQFQYQLDVQYAVGRIFFDTPGEYNNYARSVVLAETGGLALPKRVAVFATANPSDVPTGQSSQRLALPLADRLNADKRDWTVDRYIGDSARKAQLSTLLNDGNTPGVLFTASHGLGLPANDPDLEPLNGALLCQDWPGTGGAGPESYFLPTDIAQDAKLLGLISIHFACFGAGTPKISDIPRNPAEPSPVVAPCSFVSRLSQRLLSHPNGGALAFIGHVDVVLGCAFEWDGSKEPQIQSFVSAMEQIMDGIPVGAAMEQFNTRYAALSTQLLQQIHSGLKVDDAHLAGLWMYSSDSRNFVVVGDPAARLRIASQPPQEKRIIMSSTATQGPALSGAGEPRAASTSVHPAATAPTDLAYFSLPGFSSANVKDTVESIYDKICETLTNIYQGLTTVEVSTYVNDGSAVIGPDFAGAKLRALSSISLDGKARACVPTTPDGKPDETLWRIHSDMVEQALQHRVAILKMAADMASSLVSIVKTS